VTGLVMQCRCVFVDWNMLVRAKLKESLFHVQFLTLLTPNYLEIKLVKSCSFPGLR
jgi:DNA-dependent RNA polymerase auxiliary subunit epsilon